MCVCVYVPIAIVNAAAYHTATISLRLSDVGGIACGVCSSLSTSQIYQNLITYGYNMHIYNYLHKFFLSLSLSLLGFSLLFGLVIFVY